tara:strand:- start:478 stop:648 length:171 start_codon:yes stop_codon:yes gene_type:complete
MIGFLKNLFKRKSRLQKKNLKRVKRKNLDAHYFDGKVMREVEEKHPEHYYKVGGTD